MAYVTKTIPISPEWTLITTKVAMLQFNDRMYMAVTSGEEPGESVGFVMGALEKYVNGINGISVWAKSLPGGTRNESVRVAENDL